MKVLLDDHSHCYDSDCGMDFGCSCDAIDDYDNSAIEHAGHLADVLLASPVIRRIQAEALREARADIQAYTDSGSPFGHRPVEQFLDNRADRVERGETA